MSTMKPEELSPMKTIELHDELERLRRHLFDLRSQAVTEKLEDPTQITKARRDIARILTVLKQRGETNIEQRQAHLTAEAARSR
jgi:large subunit ribosomal protein L29